MINREWTNDIDVVRVGFIGVGLAVLATGSTPLDIIYLVGAIPFLVWARHD